jgi:predicted exporter
MVVAWGGSVEEALERSEEVASALDAAGLEHTSAASVLPSVRTQLANVAWLLDRDWRALGGVLDEEASSLGFRAATFDPFFEDIAAARRGEPPCLEPDDLEGTPMHHLVQGSVIAGASRAAVLTFLPGEDRDGVPGSVAAMRPGVVVASRVEIMNRVFEAVRSDVLGLIAVSLLGILLVLVLRYRRVRPALLAVVPVLVACVVTAGLFAMSDRAVNAIAVLAFTLILGVGLDYGVFIVDALGSGRVRDHAAGAVLVSGLTTLVSFGVLWTCRNPVLRSTGLVVLAGVGASLLAALLLVPALHVLLAGRKP